MKNLDAFIRPVPDFPKPGILFRDISPLLKSPDAFKGVIDELAKRWSGKADAIVALDARGFVFGSALAVNLGLPFSMVRKQGKLPGECIKESYGLEYGSDTVELQINSLSPGARVLVVDDLLATGGTALAACKLVERAGGSVVGCAFVIELADLEGRSKLPDCEIDSLISY